MDDGRVGRDVIFIKCGDDLPVSATGYGESSVNTTSQNRLGSELPDRNIGNLQEGDAPAMNRSILIEKNYFKTHMCREFRSGTCQNGVDCNFAHNIEELRSPDLIWKESVVAHEDQAPLSKRSYTGKRCRKFYTEAGCRFGDYCTQIHDEEDKRRERTVIVISPTSSVEHRDGGPPAEPPLAPPPLAAAAPPPLPPMPAAPPPLAPEASNSSCKPLNWRTRICKNWEQMHFCPYDNKCTFAHGTAELRPYGGKFVGQETNPNKQIVAATGSPVAGEGGSEPQPGAVQRPVRVWKVPKKIRGIYGDWIDDLE